MKISKVFYEKLFPTGSFLNERIGLEASLDPGDDPIVALEHLKDKVEFFHETSNPLLDTVAPDQHMPPIISEKPIPADQRIAVIIADIYSCKEFTVLESYRLMVKGNPELEAAYEEMRKKLIGEQLKDFTDKADQIGEAINEKLRTDPEFKAAYERKYKK